MTIDDKLGDEKLQKDINREVAKIPAFSSGKIDKYEYLTSEEMLPSDQRRVIEQAKFTYSLSRVLQKQIKALENRFEKNFLDTDQKSITYLFLKVFLNEEAAYELNKIVEMENKLHTIDLFYKRVNKKG